MEWFLIQPWPWWLSGILIGLTVPALVLLSDKWFGVSTSLQQIGCALTPGTTLDYLRKHDYKASAWTLFFVGGMALGGFIASYWLSPTPIEFLPTEFKSIGGAARLFIGGILVGFGTRYANGCTSGHAITGIANLNWPSLLATIFFFVGGLAVTWGLGNLIFGSMGINS
ncbi:MAG: YeeE/YedE thiosulfate transporter family protein [Pirellulaceae bacterium]